ncbi:substrate-binding domain-containing protein [Algirhabdus cladophorae]|uniref:substrate-binding domain-containing protein n=1 Tax=Algirhabdus cladophorae TaxID=3377108 RepID=UPI003B8489E4
MNLKQLSQNLGLSQTTVSRALNGYPEVSESTRHRVQTAAKQFNYTPNTRAKGLATGRSMTIGHVIPVSTKHEMVNPIFGDFIAGAGESYSKAGYDMILSIVDDADEASAYENLVAKRAIDGIILHGPRLDDPRIALLQKLGLPFVVHGRVSDTGQPYSWLDVNNRRSFQRATEFLLQLGHRRIALINGLETMDFAARRRSGFEAAMTARGLKVDPDLMQSNEMTEVYGHQAAKAMLAGPTPPTAFLVSSMIPAFGVRRAIEEAGYVMGRDISVICHDDALSYFETDEDVPVFTATRSSVRDAGRQAADMLLRKIANPLSAQTETTLLEAQLIVGGSTGVCTAS